MNRYPVALFFISLWFTLTSPVLASEWMIDDDHSNAYFSVQHLTVTKVRGSFSTVSGMVTIDDKSHQLTGLTLNVDVNSIDTGVEKRDDDLRSPNFFEVARYPSITFVSKTVEDMGYGTLVITGDLTMHGVTREVALTAYGPTPEVKDPWGMNRRGLRLGYRLNRKDYGMNYNKVMDNGGFLIGNVVDAEADLEIISR